jgi:hypothetical protein
MAEALRARDGYPNPEAHLTGGRDELDDFAAGRITRKEDWVELYADNSAARRTTDNQL